MRASALVAAAGLLGFALWSPSGCLDPRELPPRSDNNCATCHGSAAREGDWLRQAAPPININAKTDPRLPGVGAHDIHLDGAASHGPVACSECHVVPESTGALGHTDSAAPAEVMFGDLADQGDGTARYDFDAHTCSQTYCHRSADPDWTRPRQDPCGSCHELPPPAPHPQSPSCSQCHGEVIDDSMQFVNAALHVNGQIDVERRCNSCHGNEASDAPPADLLGNTSSDSIGVGAHQKHLAGGDFSAPVACATCHQVPVGIEDPGHLDDVRPADVSFSGVAVTGGRDPVWVRADLVCAQSWCHAPSGGSSNVSPVWTSRNGVLGCDTCHSTPPPSPHPQIAKCGACHSTVAQDDRNIVDRTLHIDGKIEVTLPTTCDACHGGDAAGAPPPALDGSVDTSTPGVGAHENHLAGSGIGRPVPCQECHVVPSAIGDAGHTDSSRPAELTFAGVASAFGAMPSYDGDRCGNSYCHGGMFVDGKPSGGAETNPRWTVVDGSQVTCTSCHSMPPPSPHQSTAQPCANCHANVSFINEIIDPNLHVNGVVELL